MINSWFRKSGEPVSAGISIHCLSAVGGILFFLFWFLKKQVTVFKVTSTPKSGPCRKELLED